MTLAIFGLVGVVIGGVLNGGVSYVLGRFDAKRRTKATARLLFPLFWDAEFSFKDIATGQPLTAIPRDLADRIAAVDLSVVVSEFDDDAALSLTTAVFLIEQACRMEGTVPPGERASFDLWATSIHEALEAIGRVAWPS